ncbi:MAG: DUF1592 domain-containing protein [Bryobacterales bacterium]|nr:DUF1592 domain-containing protein [Bryobacterales bacterium]
MLALTLFAIALHAETTPQIRRLTHHQYNNTVRDLLGDRTRPADQFPAEDFVNGFKNQLAAQDISPLLAQSYANAAERLARTAFLGGRDDNSLIPCKPLSPADAKCAGAFVESFGGRAFRRPLTPIEQSRYANLLLNESRRRGDFVRGAQTVVEAMLQSPKFLFRIEEGGATAPYEAATRLSYFLWETMPDAALAADARSGKLSNPAAREAVIRRMIDDPRAKGAVDEFLAQWLRFDLVWSSVKDRRIFNQFNEELAAAMTEETRLTIAEVVWTNRNFFDIFTAGYGFVNSDLAALYKAPAPGEEFVKTAYPEGRAGILSQAMFLSLTSKPGETSPTVRGYFVRDRFLCQTVPDPPPGTNSSLPPLSPDRALTSRQRLSEHVVNPVCAGCHQLMDPIGFGLEGFDAIGRQRDKESITFFPARETRNDKAITVDLPLDTSGNISGMANGKFSGPKQLGQILAGSKECHECVVKQLFRYANGRREDDGDREFLEGVYSKFTAAQFRFKDLMIWIAEDLASPQGRRRTQ